MPAKQSRKLAVFDLIAQRFVPGVRYTELEVNRELMQLYDDYVSLRRGLVDFGMLDRADGWYWRSGGSVDIGSSGDIGTRAVDRTERAAAVAATDHTQGPASPIGPTLSARGAARREAIVAAAAELFAENGYAAVGMDDIGAAAGVTGPAIYRHFEAKAAVLTEVFDRIISTVDTEPDPNEDPLPDLTGCPTPTPTPTPIRPAAAAPGRALRGRGVAPASADGRVRQGGAPPAAGSPGPAPRPSAGPGRPLAQAARRRPPGMVDRGDPHRRARSLRHAEHRWHLRITAGQRRTGRRAGGPGDGGLPAAAGAVDWIRATGSA